MGADKSGIELERIGRPAEHDLYEYTHRVEGLVRMLDRCIPPFVVAVEGEWGRGKSTFMEFVISALTRDGKDTSADEWLIIRFNPWRYQIEDFDDAWESIIEVVTDALLTAMPSLQNRIRRLAKLLGRNRLLRLAWKIGLAATPLVVPETKGPTEALREIANDVDSFSASRFERRYQLFEDIRKSLSDLSQGRRILLIIDDLDRCEPHALSHVLRAIATVFGSVDGSPKFCILLGMDRKASTHALVETKGWKEEYAAGYLDKIINLHVTLPILQVGEGNRRRALANIHHAVTEGGQRRTRSLVLEEAKAEFSIPADRSAVIARFAHYNPRELERFCLLFDLKWESRLQANAAADRERISLKKKDFDFQEWVDRFRDRIIWESIVELRWPLYDAKTADVARNKEAIEAAIRDQALPPEGLPCEEYLGIRPFLEIHRIYFESDWS